MRKVLLCLVVVSQVCFAQVSMQLVKGASQFFHLGVLPFSLAQVELPNGVTFSQQLQTNLQNTGAFYVSSYNKAPTRWQDDQVAYVLSGKLIDLNGGRFSLSAKLNNVVATKPVLVFYKKWQGGLQSLVDKLSRAVDVAIAGNQGFFMDKLAYVLVSRSAGVPTRYTLKVADMDGVASQTLLSQDAPILSPVWSPSGKKIAVTIFIHGRAQLAVLTLATGAQKIISQPHALVMSPAWVDADNLAFVSTQFGSPKIYMENLNTQAEQQLTYGYSIDAEPSFLGHQMLFTSNRGGSPQVYLLNQLAGHVQRLSFFGVYNAGAMFMGKSAIIYMHQLPGVEEMWWQNLATGRHKVLLSASVVHGFSVAGPWVLYVTRAGGRGVLGLISEKTGTQLRMVDPAGNMVAGAIFSPLL